MTDTTAANWWRNPVIQTRVLVSALLAGCVVGIVVPAGINWDFGNFYDAGRRILAGESHNLYVPKSPIAGESPHSVLGFYGTPLTAFLYVPIGILPPLWAMMFFKCQTAAFNLGALAILYTYHRRFVDASELTTGRYAAMFALVSLTFQPIWTAFRTGGQTTPMVFFFLTLSLLTITKGRLTVSALCFATAVMIKPVLITAVPVLCLLAGTRYLIAMIAIFGVAGLTSLVVFGWQVHLDFLDLMMRTSTGRYVTWFYNSSLLVVLDNLRNLAQPGSWPKQHQGLLDVVRVTIRVTVAAMCVWIAYQSRSQPWHTRARLHFAFVCALLFWAFLTHILYEAYLTFLFIPLAYALAARRHFSRGAVRLIAVIFALCFWQNVVWADLLRYFVTIDSVAGLFAIGLFKGGPVILLFVWFVRYYRELFDSYRDEVWARDDLWSGPVRDGAL